MARLLHITGYYKYIYSLINLIIIFLSNFCKFILNKFITNWINLAKALFYFNLIIFIIKKYYLQILFIIISLEMK